ncbi:MAG: sensor histidine kinase [Hyphomicrobiaceae bacterium]
MELAHSMLDLPLAGMRQKIDPLEAGRDVIRLEALGLMTAGIVHDLGNMIQILSASVEILDDHPTIKATRALRPVVGRAVRSLDRASALVQQILGFARNEGTLEEDVDLAMCFAGLERLLRWIGRDRFRLRMRVAPDLPPLFCNRCNLENVVLNLVLNARDAMPDGGTVTIDVGTREDGDWIMLRVSDTGKGMPPDIKSRAFEPFFTTKGQRRGNGLGLTMVRRFVQEAGGNVDIKSQVGEGTTVTLRFPVRPH